MSNASAREDDTNGNMIRDLDRDIVTIKYNLLNLPDTIQFKSGHQILNTYDASGRKLKSVHVTNLNNAINPIDTGAVYHWTYNPAHIQYSGTAYVDDIEYSISKEYVYQYGGYYIDRYSLNRINNPEGYTDDLTDYRSSTRYNYYRRDYLGNNREVWKASRYNYTGLEAAQTVQRTQYYPSGLPWAYNTLDNLTEQPYKYNGKEFVEMHGLDEYDSDARWYYPAIMRTTTMDPLAEKYYDISPYAWCGNNPVRFIDPIGMEFTEAAWKQINRLIDDINKRQARNANNIEKKQAQIDAGGLSEKKVAKLQKQIGRLNSNTADLESVRGEVATLAASNQMYDIKSDNSMNIEGAIPETGEYRSGVVFNFTNGNFEIMLGNSSLGALSHELKHAYQFETGAYSSGYRSDGVPFYDQADEQEAYSRGSLFGSPRINSLPSLYDKLQSGPMDVTKLAPIILSSPAELQKLANRTKSAFRVNGVTYIMQKGK